MNEFKRMFKNRLYKRSQASPPKSEAEYEKRNCERVSYACNPADIQGRRHIGTTTHVIHRKV